MLTLNDFKYIECTLRQKLSGNFQFSQAAKFKVCEFLVPIEYSDPGEQPINLLECFAGQGTSLRYKNTHFCIKFSTFEHKFVSNPPSVL